MARSMRIGIAALAIAAGTPFALAQTCQPYVEVPGTNAVVTHVVLNGGSTIVFPNTAMRLRMQECFSTAYSVQWSTGQTGTEITVTSPAAGATRTISATSTQGAQSITNQIILAGAVVGTPACSLQHSGQPRNGGDVVVRAMCSPAATEFAWSGFDEFVVAGQGTDTATFRIPADSTSSFFTPLLYPRNATGQGPQVGLAVSYTPTPPPTGSPVAMVPRPRIATGSFHACALSEGGAVSCWGNNDEGQLGDGSTVSRNYPRTVSGLESGVVSIAAGNLHSCAVRSTGLVYCWGRNASGELGNGTTVGSTVPVVVQSITDGKTVAAGNNHTCAVSVFGAVQCWGANNHGQLGNGGNTNSATPVAVTGITVKDISVSSFSTCVVTTAGGVKCWGNNEFGQLGDATLTARNRPVDVVSLTAGASQVSANRAHACAVTVTGAVRCWGENGNGQLGIGTTSTNSAVPVEVSGLGGGVSRVAAGFLHNCALATTGAVRCWGSNDKGEVGDGTTTQRLTPASVSGLGAGVVGIAANFEFACAESSTGGVDCWGSNSRGQVGDGTLALSRHVPQKVVGVGGAGLLDVTPSDGLPPPPNAPAFDMVVNGNVTPQTATATAILPTPPPGHRTFVFAYAPAAMVKQAERGFVAEAPMGAKAGGKSTPVQCVLAQLGANGQLQGVSVSNLQAYVGAVVSGQSQSVNILNGVPTAQIGGATFFVGYGTSANQMFSNGTSRSAVAIPGDLRCEPQAPQKGWWWNPAEDGRGYSIEVQGNRIFFASFLYDVTGRSTWYVATGTTSLDGSLFQGDLLAARGGQVLGGPYAGRPGITSAGPLTLAFSDATHGTIVWPGGTVPIQRLDFVPNGLNLAPLANQPESGWWWNDAEDGRGFFLEFQGDSLDIAGYMYDDAGNPVWYLTVGKVTPDGVNFAGSWWRFGNGMTLNGPWRPHQRLDANVAPLTIRFHGADTATMTLPNQRTTNLKRHRF